VLRQMLVAVDFSVWSRSAARHAFDVARAIGGTVTLLHVLEDHEPDAQNLETARALLRELGLLARRPPRCLTVPPMRVTDHDRGADGRRDGPWVGEGIGPAILAVADQLDAELIVMGPHGQGNAEARTLGRVVQQVLLDARRPVQVVSCSPTRPVTDRWSAALRGTAAC
jgi:nucleotide-binding universal stress UspA family protein